MTSMAMSSCKVAFYIFLILMVLAPFQTLAVEYSVRWENDEDFRQFTRGKIFFVGDIINFSFTGGQNGIAEVAWFDYVSCGLGSASFIDFSGNFSVTLAGTRHFFFVGLPAVDCKEGMKMSLYVNDEKQVYYPAFFD